MSNSNSFFTGVSNEVKVKINASDIITSSLKTASLTCDRLDFPGSPIDNILVTKADVTPTDVQLSFIANKGLLFINSVGLSGSSNAAIILGADSSARAGTLLSLFNINDTVTSRLIKVVVVGTATTSGALSIKNSSGSKTNVQFKTFDTATNKPVVDASATDTTPIVAAASANDGYIVVSKGTPAVTGENAILFTVLVKSAL